MAAGTAARSPTAPAPKAPKTSKTPKRKTSPADAPQPTPKPAPKTAPGPRSAAQARAIRQAAILLKQASDATRLWIMLTLLDGEQHVTTLCGRLEQSQPAVSHHLSLLRHGNLIEPRRSGKHNFYFLTEKGLILAETARKLIEQNC
jgi:DNA-binding transcriptional ArsR family regulator